MVTLALRAVVRLTALLAIVGSYCFASATASAQGTVIIVQSDGRVNTYDDVAIKIIHNSLYLTSADGKGTIVVTRAACSYQGDVLVCLPTTATLVQAGEARPVKLTTGTIYVNLTGAFQQLSFSSTKLAPHSLLFSVTTDRGTYVSVSGHIDKVAK
jgi:hypothetical protein